ncbi:MAG: hypothetical protein ABJA02_15910 [Acidobacteriota bacterium]
MYKGNPASVVLDSKRARLYRTVLRESAKEGPNFAGRYTIVTWGAGLGVFSVAVVDARTGKVYFPPFREIGNTGYGMPFVDKGDNPAWRIDSRLFAFIGRPDSNDKGMGMYVYLFERGRFRLLYFEKEDEKKRKADKEAWETEIDRRLTSMADTYESFRKHVASLYPNIRCFQGYQTTRYPWAAIAPSCTQDDLIVSINIEYLSTPDEAKEMMKSELNFQGPSPWRIIGGLGEQGIETDPCSRALIRFRQGMYYIWMNANLNRQQIDDSKCTNEQNNDSKRLAYFSRRVAFLLAGLLNTPTSPAD